MRRRFSRHDSRVQRDWCLSRDAGGLRKPEETQSSSAEVPLDKGDLGRQRLPAKAVRPWCRRSSADFGGFRFAEDDFSSNHGTLQPCLEIPRSWGRRTLPSDEPDLRRTHRDEERIGTEHFFGWCKCTFFEPDRSSGACRRFRRRLDCPEAR